MRPTIAGRVPLEPTDDIPTGRAPEETAAMSIEALFLAGPLGGARPGGPPGVRRGAPRLVSLACPAGGVPSAERCATEFDALPRGSYLAIVIDLPTSGRLRRARAFLALPSRIKASQDLLARCGARPAGRFGAAPDIRSPTVLYRLGGPASAYAEARLLPAAGSWPVSFLLAALARWAGCDTSLGSVIVIGRKS